MLSTHVSCRQTGYSYSRQVDPAQNCAKTVRFLSLSAAVVSPRPDCHQMECTCRSHRGPVHKSSSHCLLPDCSGHTILASARYFLLTVLASITSKVELGGSNHTYRAGRHNSPIGDSTAGEQRCSTAILPVILLPVSTIWLAKTVERQSH